MSLDSSSVQSLLESQTLIAEVEQSGIYRQMSASLCSLTISLNYKYLLFLSLYIIDVFLLAIDQDEEDIFQCGKCKSQFTSLHMFVLHKRTHQKTHQQTMDLTQFLTNDESQVMQTEDVVQDESQYNSQETFQLGEPIILEEADMLFRYITCLFFNIQLDNFHYNFV